MSKNNKALLPSTKETSLNNRLKSETIDAVVKRLSSTDLGKRCTPLTISRLRKFLATTDVPDNIANDDEKNGAYAFYTAQGYLNGIVSSTSKLLSDSPQSSKASRRRDFTRSIVSSDASDSVMKTIGDIKPMADAFIRGYDDGFSIMSSQKRQTATSIYSVTHERYEIISKHMTSALCSLMEETLCSYDIDADDYQNPYSDAALLVDKCVSEELGTTQVRHRLGVRSKVAQRLGIKTMTLTHAVKDSTKDIVSFVDKNIMPMTRVCKPDSPSVSMSTICFAYGDIYCRLRHSGEYTPQNATRHRPMPKTIITAVKKHTEVLPQQTADEILGYTQDIYNTTDGTAEEKDGYIVVCDGMIKASEGK